MLGRDTVFSGFCASDKDRLKKFDMNKSNIHCKYKLKTSVTVISLKLSNNETVQYLDG